MLHRILDPERQAEKYEKEGREMCKELEGLLSKPQNWPQFGIVGGHSVASIKWFFF
jgi:hypothetical protein